MLFFSRNKFFSALILSVSFFNPFTGLAGLAAAIIALLAAYFIGFDKAQIKTGLYTYSAILLGLGMGTFYEGSNAFWILLALAALLTLFISVALLAKLGKQQLPALSIGFILSLWIVILAAKEFSALGLTQRNIYWLNEMYATGGNTLINIIQKIENWPMPDYVSGFFRSLSAILFQSNVAAGIVLSIGLLMYSRIALTLIVLGYAAAMGFNFLMGGFSGGGNYYNLGTNFMLVAFAIGGFYIIPSVRSFLMAVIAVPISYLLVVGLSKITYTWGIPVFSLPFCIVVILVLYCLRLRTVPRKLIITPVQYFSPEQNLYRYLNGKERLLNKFYFHLYLPVMGEWMISQGHDGDMTHKAEWSKALDFVILDNEMKTFSAPGNLPEHFYCYNKPVLAPADGIVQEIVDHIDDNEIGKNNTAQNWGNSIVIKHAEGLYTKLSHLKKNSFKTTKGAYVKRGDIVASCGNSGRSPEPHLHMQVQATPYIGSKTLNYPLAYFKSRRNNDVELKNFVVPSEGSFVSNLTPNAQLQQAFNFQPGFCMIASAEGYANEEWETVTSFYNEPYLYCKEKNAFAYFINNGSVFYFTNYFGPKDTLLYQFYLCAYTVLLSTDKGIVLKDNYPINVFGVHPARWLQDVLAPFYIFINMKFESTVQSEQDMLGSGKIYCRSKQTQQLFWHKKEKRNFDIEISNGQLQSFTVNSDNKKLTITCVAEN